MSATELLESILPEVKGLADLVLILLVWGASVMVGTLLKGMFNKPVWLAGDRDLIVPFVIASVAGFVAEYTTPEFNPLYALKKIFFLQCGVQFLWRPSMFLQAMPDFILRLWPNAVGGDLLRRSVEERAMEQVAQPIRDLAPTPEVKG